MRLKAEREQAQRDEEQRFREEMLAKFAEDDRLEQMNAQKRRMKQLEHRRAVERLIEDRRRQFQAEKEAELEARRDEERMELLRREIVEEERQKLLKEHAAHLLGYLPKVHTVVLHGELCLSVCRWVGQLSVWPVLDETTNICACLGINISDVVM